MEKHIRSAEKAEEVLMQYKGPMLVVNDIDKSVEFYENILAMSVILDFGANKTLTGGLALQTAETYKDFIDGRALCFGGKPNLSFPPLP